VAAAALIVSVVLIASAAAAAEDPLDNLKDRLDGMTPDEQINYLDKLIEDGADDARIHFFKGNAWFVSEQYDSAIVEFDRAVTLDENYAKAWVNLGIVYDHTRKSPGARKAYSRALEINPDDVLAHCHLGFNYYSAGKHDKAMRHYEKALDIDPASAQAHYNLGLAFANAEGVYVLGVGLFPAIGQKGVEINVLSGQVIQDVSQIGPDIQFVSLGATDDRVDCRGPMARLLAADKQPVLSANGLMPHPSFTGVVVDRQASVFGVAT
jgi:tetratricopeptide (TPR) repeat protein